MRAQVRREGLAPVEHVVWRAQRPLDPREQLGVDADGRREHRNVARERLDSGEAEALTLGGHDDSVRRVDP